MSEENRLRRIETRVKNVEEAIQLLTQLTLRADERMDSFDAALNNLTVKMEALTDAQISAEARFDAGLNNLTVKMEALADAQIRTEDALGRLAEAQAHTEQRLDALIDFIGGTRNNKP